MNKTGIIDQAIRKGQREMRFLARPRPCPRCQRAIFQGDLFCFYHHHSYHAACMWWDLIERRDAATTEDELSRENHP